MTEPTPHDHTAWDYIETSRGVPLGDVGLIGYDLAVVVTPTGEERFVLACLKDVGKPVPYWPNWRQIAAHELTGAPICGSRATVTGTPCGVRVREWGRTCATHARAELELRRGQP